MRRIAVTGASGFIGGALVRRLAADGHAVVGIDADPRGAAVAEGVGAEFRRADVTNAAAVFGAVAGVDAIVHAAARVGEHGAMADFIAVNVRGTRNVLDAASEMSVGRVVVLASVAGWGYELHADVTSEDAAPRPTGLPYPRWAGTRSPTSRGAVFPPPDGARAELGWVPRVSLDEGMRRTEAWLRDKGQLRH